MSAVRRIGRAVTSVILDEMSTLPYNYFQTVRTPGLSSISTAPRGVVTLTLNAAKAKRAGFVRVGAYVDYEGRVYRVARVTYPKDWFCDDVYVRLHGAHYDPQHGESVFANLLSKLPFPKAQKEHIRWLEDTMFFGGRSAPPPGGGLDVGKLR